ncbi:MAG: hypothetical protein IJW17_13295 [Lentisphaeria bacterium]|nr:hypothetical protein [Lentisphaeria bacterium]
MLKQPKKYYRYEFVYSDRRRKSGFHREMAYACDEEHIPLIRSKRNKHALFYYSDFSYEREAEPWLDQRSWKHRCKKRHQWVKHRYSLRELDMLLAGRFSQHNAHELLKFLEENPGWIKFDLRDNPLIENAINQLESLGKIDRFSYNFYTWDCPVAVIRLKQEKEDTSVQNEIDRHEFLMREFSSRERHQNRRLPISHKYISNKKHSCVSDAERLFVLEAIAHIKSMRRLTEQLRCSIRRAKVS